MVCIQLLSSLKFSTNICHRRKPDTSKYHGCEQQTLTMFSMHLGVRGEQNRKASHLFAGFYRVIPGSMACLGCPLVSLGPHIQFPIIYRSKHMQECNPQWPMLAVTLGELLRGMVSSTSALKHSTVPISLTTHSRLIQQWQEISALRLLSSFRKQGASMFPREL